MLSVNKLHPRRASNTCSILRATSVNFSILLQDYRNGGYKINFEDDYRRAFAELLANSNLVKRPFVIGDGIATVGFKEETWQETLNKTSSALSITNKMSALFSHQR